jgi:hypothetical protein
VPAHGVDQLRALAHEQVAGTVQHQRRLLRFALHRHEPHGGPRYRLADRRRVGGIVLAALDVGLDVLRRHQPHVMTKRRQLARPEMGRGAGLHADQAGRQTGKEGDHLAAAETSPEDDVAYRIDAMHLEDMLGQIEADGRKLHRGWLP